MGRLDELARAKITAWREASGQTQTAFAEAIDRNQAWMSRYLDGEFDADLDTLERIAAHFGHTLFTLFDVSAPSDEGALVDGYRQLTPKQRELVRGMVQGLLDAARHTGPRTRPPKKR